MAYLGIVSKTSPNQVSLFRCVHQSKSTVLSRKPEQLISRESLCIGLELEVRYIKWLVKIRNAAGKGTSRTGTLKLPVHFSRLHCNSPPSA